MKRSGGSLVPLQQMAQLTTYLETLFFWSPLIPLLSLAVFGAAAATWVFPDGMGGWDNFQTYLILLRNAVKFLLIAI